MLDAKNTNSLLQVKYEDIKCGEKNAFCALFRHLSIPTDACMPAHIVESNLQMVPYEGALQSDTRTLAWRLNYELSNNKNTKKFLYDITAIQGATIATIFWWRIVIRRQGPLQKQTLEYVSTLSQCWPQTKVARSGPSSAIYEEDKATSSPGELIRLPFTLKQFTRWISSFCEGNP